MNEKYTENKGCGHTPFFGCFPVWISDTLRDVTLDLRLLGYYLLSENIKFILGRKCVS